MQFGKLNLNVVPQKLYSAKVVFQEQQTIGRTVEKSVFRSIATSFVGLNFCFKKNEMLNCILVVCCCCCCCWMVGWLCHLENVFQMVCGLKSWRVSFLYISGNFQLYFSPFSCWVLLFEKLKFAAFCFCFFLMRQNNKKKKRKVGVGWLAVILFYFSLICFLHFILFWNLKSTFLFSFYFHFL